MNLSEEKKAPLRKMKFDQKKVMLEKFLQAKGTSKVSYHCILISKINSNANVQII